MKFFILIPCCLMLLAGQKCEGQPDGLDQTALTNTTWFHSHEEDHEDIAMYRPESFPFPPSRGRTGFRLFPDGTALYYGIAPSDGRQQLPGRWEFSKDHQRLTIKTVEKGTDQNQWTYKILACNPESLRLAYIESPPDSGIKK